VSIQFTLKIIIGPIERAEIAVSYFRSNPYKKYLFENKRELINVNMWTSKRSMLIILSFFIYCATARIIP
jgi:hypothetical protein